jgi:hypothetical protein
MITISVVPVDSLTRSKLQGEIEAIFSEPLSSTELHEAAISESDFRSASATDFRLEQDAGFAPEPIIVAFASKVAYDIWKRLILPRLEKKYGSSPFIRVDEHLKK